jgi:WD40 repeat protein
VANGSMLESWEAHTYDIFSLAFHPNGRILASAGRGRDVRLWDTVSPSELLATLQSHDDMVLSLSFHPDGGRLASGSRDTSIGLWDLDYYDRHVAGNLEFQRDRVGRQDAHPATHARKPGAVP